MYSHQTPAPIEIHAVFWAVLFRFACPSSALGFIPNVAPEHHTPLLLLFICIGGDSDPSVHVYRRGCEAAPDGVRDGELLVVPFCIRDHHGRPQLLGHDQDPRDHRRGGSGKPDARNHQGCRREEGTAVVTFLGQYLSEDIRSRAHVRYPRLPMNHARFM